MTSFLERRQRVTDPAGTLVFLEMSAPSFAETLRIVNDTQNWTSNGVEFIGYTFRFKLPDDSSDQTPQAQLEIGNAGRSITEDLEALQPNETVMAKIMISDRADPDAIESTFYLPLTQVSVTGTVATAKCGVEFIMRQRAVRVVANPFTLPGIFS